MTIEQIRKAYQDKEHVPCPITERLVKAGYQQEKDGYIGYAHNKGKEIDYRKSLPTQWWHLLKAYCDQSDSNAEPNRIQCGELIFWMAEVLECVGADELNNMANRIIKSAKPKERRDKSKPQVEYERRKWNMEIKNLCFDSIVKKVETLNIVSDE